MPVLKILHWFPIQFRMKSQVAVTHKPHVNWPLTTSVAHPPISAPSLPLLFLEQECVFLLQGLCVFVASETLSAQFSTSMTHLLTWFCSVSLSPKGLSLPNPPKRETSIPSCPFICLQFYWQPLSPSDISTFTSVCLLSSLFQQHVHEGRKLVWPDDYGIAGTMTVHGA